LAWPGTQKAPEHTFLRSGYDRSTLGARQLWQTASVTQQDDITLIIIDFAGTPWNADVVVSEVESALQIASMSQQIRKVTHPTGVHECKIAFSVRRDKPA
jgi:hypothetical protein